MVETKHHDHSCNISNLILFVILSSFVIIIAYVIQFRGATIANYPISPHKINEWIDQQKYPLIVQGSFQKIDSMMFLKMKKNGKMNYQNQIFFNLTKKNYFSEMLPQKNISKLI
eukprot:gene2219-2393_t